MQLSWVTGEYGCPEGNASVYLLRKPDDFPSNPTLTLPAGGSPAAVAVSDLTGDGLSEIAIASQLDDAIIIYLGR